MTKSATMKALIEKRFSELCARAESYFNITMRDVELDFDLDEAGTVGLAIEYIDDTFAVSLNKDYIDDTVMLIEVLPHEIAHIVLYKTSEIDHKHDARFMQVCSLLGGEKKAYCVAEKKRIVKYDAEMQRLLREIAE